MHTYRSKADKSGYDVGYFEPRAEDGTVYYYWRTLAEFNNGWYAALFVSMLNGGAEYKGPINGILGVSGNEQS